MKGGELISKHGWPKISQAFNKAGPPAGIRSGSTDQSFPKQMRPPAGVKVRLLRLDASNTS
jgi:hypothetical protein